LEIISTRCKSKRRSRYIFRSPTTRCKDKIKTVDTETIWKKIREI
jgi:hypothetical protein